MDTGDILLVDETPIELRDDAQSLHDKLSEQGGKLVLEPNDEFRAWASAANDLEIVISYIEIS